MDGRYIEPRKLIWAVAEVIGQDADGTTFRVGGTMEDTSNSGACIRIRRPLEIGSRITVKWQREQFAAVAKNCRSDGRDFLLGVRRDTEKTSQPSAPKRSDAATSKNEPADVIGVLPTSGSSQPPAMPAVSSSPDPQPVHPNPEPPASAQIPETKDLKPGPESSLSPARNETRKPETSRRPERKVMQPKTVFPHFWRRKQDHNTQDDDADPTSSTMEASMNKPMQEPTPTGPRGELLNYEDIYRAVGIMSPGAGYGIHKVVDMLNSDRIRDLAKDVKRSSVLMALDAAGISADDLLTDATRRQNALTAYEAAQVKQLEEFEIRKGKENAKIEEEMEKVRAHYAERVQANLDLVAKEKDALRNWQMAMQHETQRIAEVIELCGKQGAPVTNEKSMAAAAGAQGAGKAESPTSQRRPTPLGKG